MLMSSSAVSCFTLCQTVSTEFVITDFLPMVIGSKSWTYVAGYSTSDRQSRRLKNRTQSHHLLRTVAPVVVAQCQSSARGTRPSRPAGQHGTTAHEHIGRCFIPTISVGISKGRGPNPLANRSCATRNATAPQVRSMQSSRPGRQVYRNCQPEPPSGLVQKFRRGPSLPIAMRRSS